MTNKLVALYSNTFPNIEKFYANNGGKIFVVQLFLDKNNYIKKLSRFFPANFLYKSYLVFEPLLSVLVVITQFIKSLLSHKSHALVINDIDCLYLNYAHLLKDRCKAAGLFNRSVYWLKEPFTDVSTKGLEDKTVITVYNVLSNKDCFKSFRNAIRAIFYVAKHNPNHYIRRSYTAFEFYLTYYAISKFPLETELVFANHIDRWAIAFDACPQKRKILVQHGIETKTANWPVKLNTVTTLFAFNQELGQDVTKALLTHEPEYKYMKPTITLVNDEKDKNYKVLIVCHPAAMRDREEYLISHLQQPNITVYAKTHYTTPDLSFYEDLTKHYKYHLITTKMFPKVNTLISYRSTLVSEYEICGVPALMYADFKSLDEIVERVKRDANDYEKEKKDNG